MPVIQVITPVFEIAQFPQGNPCCCGGKPSGTCSPCQALVGEILWAKLRRVGGDWSDCGSGAWMDGEVLELTYQGIGQSGDGLCDGGHTWLGHLACGDWIRICCNPDNDGFDRDGNKYASWWFSWCDGSNSYTGESICDGGVWTIGAYGIGGGVSCTCETGQFVMEIYRTRPE